jgi:hypothetical protein
VTRADWFFHAEGSSRSAAILRVALPCLVWARFAEEMMPLRDFAPTRVAIGLAFYVSSLFLCIGFQSRPAAAALGAVLLSFRYYLGFHEGQEPYVHHHVHLLALATCLLALTPCDRSYSLDRWLRLRRGTDLRETGNLLGLRLLVVLLSSIYVWGTVSKLTPWFLDGDRMAQIFLSLYWGSDPTPRGFQPLMIAMSWGTLVVEPFLAVALWIPRLRWAAVIVGAIFHLALYVLLPVSTFSLTMIVLYVAAFDPEDVHRFLEQGGAT